MVAGSIEGCASRRPRRRRLQENGGRADMSIKLSAGALTSLPADIAVPKYRRADLSAGIIHFGVGNFHRAHQAVYLDDLFARGRDHDWAIVGAGVRDADKAVRAALQQQDW